MALLGAYIDERTHAAINSNASATFAHGLPAAPDLVIIRETTSSASSVSHINPVPIFDATNVSIFQSGERNSTALEVTSIMFHSIIR